MRWQSEIRFQWFSVILQLAQATKDLSNIIFGFSLYCLLIPCTFVNKQTKGIIISNHSPETMASGNW